MTTFFLFLLVLALFFPLVVLTTARAYIRCVLTEPLPLNFLNLASTLSRSQGCQAYIYNQTNALAHALSIGHHVTSQPVLCRLGRIPLLQQEITPSTGAKSGEYGGRRSTRMPN